MLNGLDLFSGIGGIGLALEQWVRTVAYCERERYAQGVLLSRMQSGEIDTAPIWDDVTTLRGNMLPRIDIIFGGFPCQDISVAGAGRGLEGERSGLFFEIVRLIKECQPRFVFLENVPAIRTRGGERVVKELAKIGYDCRWTTISAASVGAPHKRERWFLLAHASNGGRGKLLQQIEELRISEQTNTWSNGEIQSLANSNGMRKLSKQGKHDRISNRSKKVSNTSSKRLERHRQKPIRIKTKLHYACDNSWWAVEPSVGRVANGIPNRVHRIKCLGNGVVPLQVRTAFLKLMGIE